jgi:hypothetical protein
MLTAPLLAIALFASADVSCEEVRRVRGALLLQGLDDTAVATLQGLTCPAGGVTNPPPPPPREARVVSDDCRSLLVLSALESVDGGSSFASLARVVCDLGQALPLSSSWSTGKLQKNGANLFYWPDGKLAQNGRNVFYWPNGKLAQNGSNVWYFPSGKVAQNGATTFYAPTGRMLQSRTSFYALACETNDRACTTLSDLPVDVAMPWLVALVARGSAAN